MYVMFDQLEVLTRRPEPFSQYTAPLLWASPHISQKMLAFHLSQETELASRPVMKIDQTVSWIDKQIGLEGKQICDLGCGPGLYASRFHMRGARVTGLDISSRSIDYAKGQAANAGHDIQYRQANYLDDHLPEENDLVTLIYADYCALSPQQRKHLLAKIHASLKMGGALILDVFTHNQFLERTEDLIFEPDLMDGFWAPKPYFGFQKNWVYPDLHLTLDHYLIVSKELDFEVYNWLQYFSATSLKKELVEAGFAELSLFSLDDGVRLADNQTPDKGEIIAIARKVPVAS